MDTADSPPPTLTLADLESMVRIIAVASKRGTFEAGELASVGTLHDRLTVYLAHVKQTAAAAAPEEAEAAAPAAE